MNYILITDLPRACIIDCGAGGGSKDDAVDYWLSEDRVKPVIDRLSPEAMRCCLEGYGAWDSEDLADTEQNEARILWLACGDFAEYIAECEAAGIDPFGGRPEDFEPGCGSDIFTLE